MDSRIFFCILFKMCVTVYTVKPRYSAIEGTGKKFMRVHTKSGLHTFVRMDKSIRLERSVGQRRTTASFVTKMRINLLQNVILARVGM